MYYDLEISDKKLKSQLDGANKHVKGFGDKLNQHWDHSVNASKKILAGLTVATGAVVAFGVSSVKSFQESEKVQAALTNTLRSTAGASGQTVEGMNKLSAQLQSTTGFTDEFIGVAQNMLLTFTKVGSEIFPQATKATLDMARQFGGDAQQNAIRLGKALNDPIQGITALSRIGVQFSDVQKQQIQNFMDAGDIMSAQKVILGEITTQTGGAAEAYGKTFAGQINILKASFDDLKEGLGQLIMTALKPLIGIFAGWMKHVNEAGGFLEYFKGIIKRNEDAFKLVAGTIVGMLVPAIVSMTVSFGAFLLTIAPWALLGAGVVLLFQKLKISFDDIKNAIAPVLGAMGAMAQFIWGMLKPAFEQMIAAIKQMWLQFQPIWQQIDGPVMTALKGLAIFIIGPIVVAILTFIAAIVAAIFIITKIITFISLAQAALYSFLSTVGNGIRQAWSAVETFGGKILGWFRSLPSWIRDAVSTIVTILMAPFKTAFNAIAKAWNNTVGKLSFKAPSWIPGIGGKGWDMPDIPVLDVGGLVTRPTMAMLAANSRPEAVIPLDKLRDIGGTTINIGTIQDRSDADYLLEKITRSQWLEGQGLSSP